MVANILLPDPYPTLYAHPPDPGVGVKIQQHRHVAYQDTRKH